MALVSLPIREYADKIVKAVQANPVTIVIGETGSGKTTQIAQVSLELLQHVRNIQMCACQV